MKKGIHPEYQDTVFVCACGAEVRTRSTKPEYRLEICSACHPFFTGKQKLVDSAGRVERFMKKYADKPVSTGKKTAKPAKVTKKPSAAVRIPKPKKKEEAPAKKPSKSKA